MARTHDVGDAVRLRATFRDEAGDLADPTEVALSLLLPDRSTIDPEPARESLGVWSVVVDVTQSGTWRYRWQATGAVTAAEEGSFDVRRRMVP